MAIDRIHREVTSGAPGGARRRSRPPRSPAASLWSAAGKRLYDPDDVRLGGANSATTSTRIRNTVNDETVLRGASDGAGTGRGRQRRRVRRLWLEHVRGPPSMASATTSASYGSSPSGTAVVASTTSRYEPSMALSASGPAFIGESGSDSVPAKRCGPHPSAVNTGLQGHSGLYAAPASPAKTGVFGSAVIPGRPLGRCAGHLADRARRAVRRQESPVSAWIRRPPQRTPGSGAAGDLFVDGIKRLWFCKGGTSWVLAGSPREPRSAIRVVVAPRCGAEAIHRQGAAGPCEQPADQTIAASTSADGEPGRPCSCPPSRTRVDLPGVAARDGRRQRSEGCRRRTSARRQDETPAAEAAEAARNILKADISADHSRLLREIVPGLIAAREIRSCELKY